MLSSGSQRILFTTPAVEFYMPTYKWFKYTCICSWIIIIISTVTACTSIATLASLDDVRTQVCAPFGAAPDGRTSPWRN